MVSRFLPVVRSSTKKYPLRDACITILRAVPSKRPSTSTGTSDCVPVVRVVGRCLKSPRELAGIRIECDDAAGPAVVAGAHGAVQHRRRISRADVHQVELGIVGAGHPHLPAGGAAARRVRRADRRRAVERPLMRAHLGIERLQHAGQVVEVSGDTDQQVIADDQRRVRRPEAAFGVGDFDVPLHRPGLRVERDQVGVGRGQEHRAFVDRRAAMADVESLIGRIGVAPQLSRRSRIEGPDVVWRRDVDDAVGQDRRRLDLLRLTGLKRPRQRQLSDVAGRDLRQPAMTLARVVAVIGGPAVGGRLEHCRVIERLRRRPARRRRT